MSALILLVVAACTCRTEPAAPEAPAVDRTVVRQRTCYADAEGFRVALELSAGQEVPGEVTRPDGATEVLVGRRSGRVIRFPTGSAELRGRSLAWSTADGERALDRVGCEGVSTSAE